MVDFEMKSLWITSAKFAKMSDMSKYSVADPKPKFQVAMQQRKLPWWNMK